MVPSLDCKVPSQTVWSGLVWVVWHAVMKQNNSMTKHDFHSVLNWKKLFLECHLIPLNIYCFASWQKINQQHPFPIPESVHMVFCWNVSLYLYFSGSHVPPFNRLLLRFWSNVRQPGILSPVTKKHHLHHRA